ncbi:MAG: histidinol-phosphatase [Candidatus Zixiibacteriota bacterium]
MPEKKRVTPLEIGGLADMHCHCDYSIDAVGTIDEYCNAALERGLAEICFTTHYDSNPNAEGDANHILIGGKRKPATIDNLAPYVENVQRAREEYYPLGLAVKLGLEFGWYPNCEKEVEKLKNCYPFEYVLCGVHEIDNVCFCCVKEYERCFARFSVEQMAERYFGDVITAARSGLFDTIAHLEYYRKYGVQYYGQQEIANAWRPHAAELAQALQESGTGLEVNTAALRKGLNGYYPQVNLVNALRRIGVEVQHLGSDAHTPEDVGYDFDAAASLIPHAIGGCDD